MTGRTEEVDVIVGALNGAQGQAGVAVIGAAGVGKTRLVREASEVHRARGWTVRWLAGTAAAQSVPLGAFAQWAESLDGDPLQLVGSVIAAVTASADDAPVLICVDDAHRLDDLSAFVLHQLVLRGSAKAIITIRTGEPAPDVVTTLWKDGHLRRLDVYPLLRKHFDALLETVLAGPVERQAASRLWQLTQGNALFLQEIVKHELQAQRLSRSSGSWAWTGPVDLSPALVELVDLQLGQADQLVLDVVDMVALAEPLELVHLVTLADSEAIEESERRGSISVSSGSPGVVRLGHPLFGEVRLARAGRWRLARLRGRLVRAMTATDSRAGPQDPVRLALLWLDSDLPANVGVYTLAAEVAAKRLDLLLAARFAEAAVDAGASLDAEILLAQLHSLSSRGEDAELLLSSLTRRQLPEEAWIAAVSLRAANLLWTLGRPDESFAVMDEALATSSPAGMPSLLSFRAVQFATVARPAEAVRTTDSIGRGRLAPLPAMMRAWALTIAHGDVGNARQSAAAAEVGAALAATSPEVAFQGGGLAIYYADALILQGDPTTARLLAQNLDAQMADVPGVARTNVSALNGFTALATGDARTAVELLGAAHHEYERIGSTVGTEHFFGVAHVLALALTADADAARDALTSVQRNRHRALLFLEPSLRLAEAWVVAERGHLAQARAIATEAAEFARGHGQYAREVSCLQAAIQFGDTRHANRLVELARRVEGPRIQLVARWATALADHDGLELSSVSDGLEAMGDRIAAADAAAHASLAFQRQNRRGAALTAAGRATRIIDACGASTPATRAAAMPLPFSRREREVAQLVSDGLSNKEIAAAMMVSIRTVEGHIYQACRKLGVGSRIELARVLDPLTDTK